MSFQLKIPRLAIPEIKIPKGIIHFHVGPFEVTIPPADIVLLPEIQLLAEIVVFDTDWILSWFITVATSATTATSWLMNAVWQLLIRFLDSLAADYSERHSEEEEST